MCFSATASFLSSALLTTIGIYSLMNIPHRRFALFAAIPLLFGIQQFSEGLVWCDIAPQITSRIFLTFAFLIWPIWMSPALYSFERSDWHKNLLIITGILGSIWAGIALWSLFINDIVITKGCCHIYYGISLPWNIPTGVGLFWYYIAVVLPFMVSSYGLLRFFGVLITLSIGITLWLWYHYFISVWCFFAALLSIFVYRAIKQLHRH